MSYEALKKLYYRDENLYKETYQRRLAEGTRLDFTIGERQAFFIQDDEVVRLMYEILRLDKENALLQRKLPPVALEQYTKKCLIDEIVLTNNIEGVRSSRQEIGEVLERLEIQSVQKSRERQKRVDGIVRQYRKLLKREVGLPRDCQGIRTLYDELVLDAIEDKSKPDGALFRKEQTVILAPSGKVIHKGMTPESRITAAMEQALAFLREDSIEPLYRICLFHYLYEYIHPFYDGNGRLGRFILSCGIMQNLEGLCACRLSGTIQEHLKAYYDAFELCNDYRNLGDLTPFLIMLLQMLRDTEQKLKDALVGRIARLKRYRKVIPSLPHAQDTRTSVLYETLITAALFSEGGISRRTLLKVCHSSSTTLKSRLDEIEQAGFLVTVIQGKEKYYQLNLEKLDTFILGI